MGNENNQGVITFQGSSVPSMLMKVALMGLQAFHNYYPTLTTLINPLVILPTICYTPKMHAQHYLPYVVSCTHSWLYCLPFTIVPLSLQIVAFKFSLASYHHILVTTFLWQPIAFHSKGHLLICNLAPFCKKNVEQLWKKGSNTLSNLKLYYFPHLLIEFKCLQNT